MEIKVLFFGVIADVTGISFKTYTGVKSIGDLRLRIEDEYPEIIHYHFRVSHNRYISGKDIILRNGDEVALLPPFAGG